MLRLFGTVTGVIRSIAAFHPGEVRTCELRNEDASQSLQDCSPEADLLQVQATPKPESPVREVVFESEHMSVWWHPEQRLIYHQMHKYCFGEAFRAGMTAGTQAMQRHRAISWLSDDRLNGPLPEEDEQWAGAFWFQQTKAAGWKYWAMVLPERAVGKLNVKRYIELSRKRGIEVQSFVTPVPALEWLSTRRV